jgi:hypothetical protein
MEAKTQSAARLTTGTNTSTDQSGKKLILLRMRPTGQSTTATKTIKRSQWTGPKTIVSDYIMPLSLSRSHIDYV